MVSFLAGTFGSLLAGGAKAASRQLEERRGLNEQLITAQTNNMLRNASQVFNENRDLEKKYRERFGFIQDRGLAMTNAQAAALIRQGDNEWANFTKNVQEQIDTAGPTDFTSLLFKDGVAEAQALDQDLIISNLIDGNPSLTAAFTPADSEQVKTGLKQSFMEAGAIKAGPEFLAAHAAQRAEAVAPELFATRDVTPLDPLQGTFVGLPSAVARQEAEVRQSDLDTAAANRELIAQNLLKTEQDMLESQRAMEVQAANIARLKADTDRTKALAATEARQDEYNMAPVDSVRVQQWTNLGFFAGVDFQNVTNERFDQMTDAVSETSKVVERMGTDQVNIFAGDAIVNLATDAQDRSVTNYRGTVLNETLNGATRSSVDSRTNQVAAKVYASLGVSADTAEAKNAAAENVAGAISLVTAAVYPIVVYETAIEQRLTSKADMTVQDVINAGAELEDLAKIPGLETLTANFTSTDELGSELLNSTPEGLKAGNVVFDPVDSKFRSLAMLRETTQAQYDDEGNQVAELGIPRDPVWGEGEGNSGLVPTPALLGKLRAIINSGNVEITSDQMATWFEGRTWIGQDLSTDDALFSAMMTPAATTEEIVEVIPNEEEAQGPFTGFRIASELTNRENIDSFNLNTGVQESIEVLPQEDAQVLDQRLRRLSRLFDASYIAPVTLDLDEIPETVTEAQRSNFLKLYQTRINEGVDSDQAFLQLARQLQFEGSKDEDTLAKRDFAFTTGAIEDASNKVVSLIQQNLTYDKDQQAIRRRRTGLASPLNPFTDNELVNIFTTLGQLRGNENLFITNGSLDNENILRFFPILKDNPDITVLR
tara:strand:+ start:2832 stop:5312 length:2481 start_codon:yes stop_codon:yes gene_type:complete